MRVMMETTGVTIFVASRRPPSPTSTTPKSTRSHALEIGRMRSQLSLSQQFLDYCLYPRERFREQLVADLFAAHPYALIDAFQMRRSVQPGPEARIPQDAFEERRRRAFAVCARNVHRRIRAVGPPQALCQHRYVLQVEFCGGSLCRRSQFAAE